MTSSGLAFPSPASADCKSNTFERHLAWRIHGICGGFLKRWHGNMRYIAWSDKGGIWRFICGFAAVCREGRSHVGGGLYVRVFISGLVGVCFSRAALYDIPKVFKCTMHIQLQLRRSKGPFVSSAPKRVRRYDSNYKAIRAWSNPPDHGKPTAQPQLQTQPQSFSSMKYSTTVTASARSYRTVPYSFHSYGQSEENAAHSAIQTRTSRCLFLARQGKC